MIDRRLSAPAAVLCISAAFLLSACGGDGPRRSARETQPTVIRDTPTIFQGTVGSQAALRGTESMMVSGFGLVVGLNGTGGGPLPVQIQATMERELAIGGIGRGGPLDSGPLAGMTPKQVLADPAVAVVIVEGVIAPGAPRDAVFDVRVRTLSGSSVSSLEGGTLWTSELRIGQASPFGSTRARKFAEAYGQVFLNPFADPAGPKSTAAGDDGVTRTVGRIIGGGHVSDPLSLELLLDNPSHARASSIVQAINSRFPQGPGDDVPTARGRNDSSIAVRVPHALRNQSDQFIKLLQYTPMEPAFVQEYAKRYVEALENKTPELAEEFSWALVALGKPAIPFVQPLYDSAQLLPRMAALRAGAKLGDMRTVPHLKQVATSKEYTQAMRTEAILLMGQLGFDPAISFALRDLVDSSNLETRIAAYEALSEREDPFIQRVQMDDRFTIDSVPSTDELVYITQQGKPRIVVFGENAKLKSHALVSVWKDRLTLLNDPTMGMKAAEPGTNPLRPEPGRPLRLRYVEPRTGQAIVTLAPDRLVDLVQFLGAKPQSDDAITGLGLTYSQVVGVLYQIQQQKACAAAFTTEENRLMAQLLSAENDANTLERPENDAKRESAKNRVIVLNPGSGVKPAEKPSEDAPLVVPLKPKTE